MPWSTPAVRQGIMVLIAVLIFLVDGAVTVEAFLQHNLTQEILGPIGAVLAMILAFLVRRGHVPPKLS